MKRKSNLVLFVCITFAIIMLSISTTLALVKDDESKVGNIIKFDKVSIMGDVDGGSKLSVNIDDRNVGNTIEIIGENFGGEELYIKPAAETREMYIRCRVYFTFGDEELDAANEDALNSFIAEDGFPKGFEIYSSDAVDYKFVKSNGWAYLVTKDSEDLLKVVTEDDRDTKFILCNKYIMGLDTQYEEQIINVIETNNLGYLQMKVEAQAIQAYGLANLTVEEGNEILSSGTETLEEKFGNAKIAHYEEANKGNLEFASISGLPTRSNTPFSEWTWNEISVASNLIEKAFTGGFLTIIQKTIPTVNVKYDEIVRAKPLIMIDNVRLNYYAIGTYGSSDYDRVFTFDERGIVNEIHLRDEKVLSVNLNGQKNVTMMVSNFLHDEKSNGRAGITFTSKTVIPGVTSAHNYGDCHNVFGYYRKGSFRPYLNNTYLPAVKTSIGNIIKPVIKGANFTTYNGYSNEYGTDYVADNIWLLSEYELITSKNSYNRGQKWYPIYVTNADRIKSNANYALRNAGLGSTKVHWGYSPWSGGYYITSAGASAFNNSSYYIAFGFCV